MANLNFHQATTIDPTYPVGEFPGVVLASERSKGRFVTAEDVNEEIDGRLYNKRVTLWADGGRFSVTYLSRYAVSDSPLIPRLAKVFMEL
jgi:hypothetical protein